MTQEAQLKACPFCGGEATIWKAFPQANYPWAIGVEHTDSCPDAGWEGLCHKTEAEAIAAWNTRIESGVVAELVEAARGPNDDARDGKPTDPRKSVHEALAILRNYSPDELAKHGITLAPEKDWATELWADLFAVRGMPSAAKSTREGRLDDEDQAAIALIRERVVLKGEG